MANNFKKVIDRQMWVPVAPAPNAHTAGACMCSDLRSDISRNPFAYDLISASVLNRFNIVSKGSGLAINPVLGGTFGIGAACVFAPSQGLKGTITTGATTTSIPTSTVITSVAANMLANRGGSGDYGFKIRVIGKAAGKVEERFIIANTAGTTPTFLLDNPLTFTPALNDNYEILSGRVFMLSAGTLAATTFRSFEIAANTLASGGTTNLPATVGTDSAIVALDEQYTPYDCNPGEGFIKGTFEYDNNLVSRKALSATAATAGTITGQASGGDATVVANEYRNFQIRIVQDTVNPTAVGQRAYIASHTAGASPVYTLGANWAVTPSSSAKFVIEYPNLIVLRSSATTTTYTYNYNDAAYNNATTNLAANTWSTTLFGTAPAANAAGNIWCPAFGIRPDTQKNSRHSHLFFFRGTAVTLDLLDIAGGTTGLWTGAITYDGNTITMGTGTSSAYAPFEGEGRFSYINAYVASAINQIYRFDTKHRVLSPYVPTDDIQAGTAAVGNRMAAYAAIDGTDLYDVILLKSHASTKMQELIVLV
jgi:hypothetical protein